MSAQPVRVLVVDDSALMRKLIPQILETDNSIQVVGTAMDGNFGLKKIAELKPQVITLDLEMPGMGGLDMLKEIMRRHRIPVIVVSSHSTEGASITLKALSLGAFDFVAKPSDVSQRMQEVATELISKIKAAAQSRGHTDSCGNRVSRAGAAAKGKAGRQEGA
jgi:two-component system chemotaxis response regulator CheB